MNADSVERLFLKRGERVTDAHVRALDRAIAGTAKLGGIGTRRRVLPWGTITSFAGRGGGGADAPVFRPEVSILEGGEAAEVRWSGPRALIGGIVPTIVDAEIFTEDPVTGLRPALRVERAQCSEAGECGIFFRVEVNRADDFRAATVTPIAAPALPPREPGIAHKLALFLRLRRDRLSYIETDDRELFSSQGFLAILRRDSGIFEPLFWATF